MPEAKKAASAAGTALLRASESSDPAVHQLMAEADIHRQNGDKEAAAAVAAKLAELGYA